MPATIWIDEYLKVNNITLCLEGVWIIKSLEALEGIEVKGVSTPVPHARGSLSNPNQIAERVVPLILIVFGEKDHNGDPHAEPKQGCKDNVAYLRANLGIASQTGDGTVAAVWHQNDGTELEANVRVVLHPGRKAGGGTLRFMPLDLIVPDGEFT